MRALDGIAAGRGQSLAQMALAWTLRDPRVTSTLVGASSVAQLEQNVATLERLDFSADELAEIDGVLDLPPDETAKGVSLVDRVGWSTAGSARAS